MFEFIFTNYNFKQTKSSQNMTALYFISEINKIIYSSTSKTLRYSEFL